MTDRPAISSTEIDASPADVFAALTDVETYPDWLVGAQRIRAVDATWPERGGRFHHTIGIGPLQLRDATEVIESVPNHRLQLRAGIGPFGAAMVTFRVSERQDRSTLDLEEIPDGGIVRVLWRLGGAPFIRWLLWGRNAVSLDALRQLVEPGS